MQVKQRGHVNQSPAGRWVQEHPRQEPDTAFFGAQTLLAGLGLDRPGITADGGKSDH